MPKPKKDKIQLLPNCPYVILCEGVDEKYFFIYYVAYLVMHKIVPDCINIIDMGGNEELRKNLPLLPKVASYQDMKRFLLIRDAETDAQGAIQSLQHSIEQVFQVEIEESGKFISNHNGMEIGFALLPGMDETGTYQNGTLEDLCIHILNDIETAGDSQAITEKAEMFLSEVTEKRKTPFKTPHKNRLHAYFAGTDKFVGQKIGEAAKAGCFDFSHEKLDFLKQAIINLTR